ncbi:MULTISPECIES: phage adaptor protein [unclassified Rhizobium]|uniref:phage adaptor protein n=1 Tax=unclassified Rhizobium TaxID=2613769 RepID=UPI0007E9F7EB|nr:MULTISPECIES: hypothetical protein [unclassified Rhizobium]ANM10394.1 hypothetical protein AMK05_CH02008 [Rhizobium sp. N324]ANM16879.1 hypothetical protein AMK06_CH01977 [Rhizobium sp. N541]ANM23264.1 hypothetical protein AMK07_CH01974 [Rhizobium sp. N941]OYD03724.1 hypothetical protein AMK08_CH101742 [Rhizobium sp. N4311]
MSLLTIIQNVCAEIDLDPPTAVMSSADPQIMQLRILSTRAGRDLMREHDWSALMVQRQFTATGVIPEPAEPPSDWNRFLDNATIWNNSRLWQLNGPVDGQTWQRETILNSNPVPQLWRRINGKLAIYPNVAGETMSYEYVSANWVAVNGGTTYAATWANDTDMARFPEELLELSTIWRWKRAKGLDYGEELENFERAKESAVGSDRAAAPTDLSLPNRGQVPENYWPGTISL